MGFFRHEKSRLREQGAKISLWGVGTRLVTAYDQPALGGIYKLGAVRPDNGHEWTYPIKLSEQRPGQDQAVVAEEKIAQHPSGEAGEMHHRSLHRASLPSAPSPDNNPSSAHGRHGSGGR